MVLALDWDSRKQIIDEALDRLLPLSEGIHSDLYAAARYAVLGTGKRLRPLIAITTAELLGAPLKTALTPACAIEMIHAYSMVHDDLPCMDDDDFRRGRPTVHRVYSEGHAVLTGDFLLTYAFEVVAKEESLSANQKIALVQLLAKSAGGEGMIGGQLLDIEAPTKNVDFDALKIIHKKKTGALIAAAFICGGIAANVSSAIIGQLEEIGFTLGLAFQIVDDILDVTSSHEKHGKACSSDSQKGKNTSVTLLGLDKAQSEAKELLNKSIAMMQRLPSDMDPLIELSRRLIQPR